MLKCAKTRDLIKPDALNVQKTRDLIRPDGLNVQKHVKNTWFDWAGWRKKDPDAKRATKMNTAPD